MRYVRWKLWTGMCQTTCYKELLENSRFFIWRTILCRREGCVCLILFQNYGQQLCETIPTTENKYLTIKDEIIYVWILKINDIEWTDIQSQIGKIKKEKKKRKIEAWTFYSSLNVLCLIWRSSSQYSLSSVQLVLHNHSVTLHAIISSVSVSEEYKVDYFFVM